MVNLKDPYLEPELSVHLHVDVVKPFTFFCVVGRRNRVPEHQLRPLERGLNFAGRLVALVEGRQQLEAEAVAVVERLAFDVVVVDADPLVAVADGDVDGEVEVEGVGGGEGELREGGGLGVGFEAVGADDEPDDEDDDAEDDDDGEDELEEGAEEAGAGVAAGAAADAAVRVLRGDRRAVVGAA